MSRAYGGEAPEYMSRAYGGEAPEYISRAYGGEAPELAYLKWYIYSIHVIMIEINCLKSFCYFRTLLGSGAACTATDPCLEAR